MKTMKRMGWAGVSSALLATVLGCGGSDVSSFGEGPGGGGGASAAGDPTGGPTSTGATTSGGSQGGAGEGAAGQGGSGQGASGQGGSGPGGSGPGGQGGAGQGAAGQGGTGQGGAGPGCGDDVCGGGETCESCEDDCGPCEPECVEHTDCSSDDLCDAGVCASAYGRTYSFTVVDGFFPVNDPSFGTTWDPVGLPDPFVELCGAELGCPAATTTTKDEQNAPVWNESFSVTLEEGGGDVWFLMWDEDFQDHDFALQTPIGSPEEWVDIVRTEGGTYVHEQAPGLDLRIDVSPL